MIPVIKPRGHADVPTMARSELHFPPGALRSDESGIFIVEVKVADTVWRLWRNQYYTSRGEADGIVALHSDLKLRVTKLAPADSPRKTR